MKMNEVKLLKAGDIVFWTDPDAGLCSRVYTIKSIDFLGDNVVQIEENDGSSLECLPAELSLVKKYRCKKYWEVWAEVEVYATSKRHAVNQAIDAPLPSSDTWEYVPDSANVDEELDIQEIKES